jgi:Protein of unknown function (DUF998)
MGSKGEARQPVRQATGAGRWQAGRGRALSRRILVALWVLTCYYSKTEGAAGSTGSGRRRFVFVRTVPGWGVASAVLAPCVLIGGWSFAAGLQPGSFDAVSRSISTLAAYGATDRWVMTTALIVVASANAITGLGLRPAARNGRILLIAGGIFGLLVALSPQPMVGSSIRHEIAAGLSCAAMTVWPLAGMRREHRAPFGLRPGPAIWATGVVVVFLAWFCFEVVSGGDMIGLAERTLTGAQTIWPLFVVLTVLVANRRRPFAALPVIPRSPGQPAWSGSAGGGPGGAQSAGGRAGSSRAGSAPSGGSRAGSASGHSYGGRGDPASGASGGNGGGASGPGGNRTASGGGSGSGSARSRPGP